MGTKCWNLVPFSTTFTIFAVFSAATIMVHAQSPPPVQYCSKFNSPSSPVQGFFAIQSQQNVTGTARYSFEMTFTVTADMEAKCPKLKTVSSSTTSTAQVGLKYHLHSIWANQGAATEALLAECGPTYTGGHYDPNFACGGASQWKGTSSFCNSLGRTSAQGYSYPCNPTAFAENPGVCEIGDTSGKFGQAKLRKIGTDSNGLPQLKVTLFDDEEVMMMSNAPQLSFATDTLPAYDADYWKGNGTSTSGWSSVVFHCGDSAAPRLFCAKIDRVNSWEECVSSTSTFPQPPVLSATSTDSPPPPREGVQPGAVAALALAGVVIGALLGLIIFKVAVGGGGDSNRRHPVSQEAGLLDGTTAGAERSGGDQKMNDKFAI